MKNHTRIHALWLGSVLAFAAAAALSPVLNAQSQDSSSSSVAEAARKAKEQKKTAPKDGRVITDDTIHLRTASADSGAPPAGTVVTTVPASAAAPQTSSASTDSTTSPSAPDAAKSADASAKAAPGDGAKKEAQSAEVAKAKELLAQVQSELDVLKRELALDSDSFFSNPDYSHDAGGKAKLDELQKMIGDKQVSVEDLKQQLAALLQKAGISPDSDKAPAPPKN